MNFWFGNFAPQRVLLDLGVIQIYWYSFIIVIAISAAYYVARRLYLRDHANDRDFADVSFYLVLCGLVGARLWHVFVFQWEYYAAHPSEILQIWQGGIAIQGAVIGGLLCLFVFSRIKKIDLWYITNISVVGLALGQAIGRWGNYFNQELYGTPTELPWAVFIEPMYRVPGFEDFTHFHPAFIYESILSAFLFLLLWKNSHRRNDKGFLFALYLMGYGVIRFIVDFIRIDPMPGILGLRSSQIISLLFISVAAVIMIKLKQPQRSAQIEK